MKKLLGIVVLGLLLSGNAYAKDLKVIWNIELDDGSAYKIQTWFRNLPWYVKAKFQRVYLPYYKQRKAVWMNSARASKRAKRRKKKEAKAKRDAIAKGTGGTHSFEDDGSFLAKAKALVKEKE